MKKNFIYGIVVVAIITATAFTLIKNKKELDKAKIPINRTNVPVTVLTTLVKTESVEENLKFPATIQPYDEVKLFAETSGMIKSLNLELGQHVSKGQLIGTLDERILRVNLNQAEINARSSEINLTKLKNDYLRAKDLFENKAGLEIDMLTAKNNYQNAENNHQNAINQINLAKEQLRNAKITAPISGIVSLNNIKNGEFVNPGTSIATITDISRLKTTVYVEQSTGYLLKTGHSAQISSPVFGERILMGKIIYISPIADANHNFQVDLLVENKEEIHLRGGTDVVVSFALESKKTALVVPKTAIMTDKDNPYVYIVENSLAKIKTIATGKTFGDKVEVLSGLENGQQVIISGQINLYDGSKIKILKNEIK